MIASHANSRAVCAHTRNLSDDSSAPSATAAAWSA
ncbi:MAG: hypothetical protein ACLTG4_05010 [Oscillospiraceae bacterium]